MLTYKAVVVINTVIRIRHMYHGAAPAAESSASALERCGMVDMPRYYALTVYNILHPFLIKCSAVKHNHSGICAELTVSGISEALSCRAVRRHSAVHILKLGSQISFIQPVECFVVAFKMTSFGKVSVYNASLNRFCVVGKSKIPEAVPAEMRMHEVPSV